MTATNNTKLKRKRIWRSIVTTLAAIVVFVTTYALIIPAITWERTLICGLEEHVHTDNCYSSQGNLKCGKDEHKHTDACFDAPKTSIKEFYCNKCEHFHTEECYFSDGTLKCTLEEHAHTAFCKLTPSAQQGFFIKSNMLNLLLGATPSYDTDFVANHVRIKVNVYNQDEARAGHGKIPVPGVEIGIDRHTTATVNDSYGPQGIARNIITMTSDNNGVAYIDVPFIVVRKGAKDVVYLNGIQDANHCIFDSMNSASNIIFFDIGSISSGYSTDLVNGLIRNCLSGANGGGIQKNAAGAQYYDFFFHGGIVNQWTTNFSYSDPAHPAPQYGGGSFIEFDLYVKPHNCTVTYENNKIAGWNASDYPSQTVVAGNTVTQPSLTPVNSVNSAIPFLGWANKATGALFDFSVPVTDDITLVPKWGPNPNATGYIHLDSFLWNHDAYNGTYRTGQTTTEVKDLTYAVQYYDQAVATTTVWHTLTYVSVDEHGQADFELTPEMLQELSDFRDTISSLPPVNGQAHVVAIDIGPLADDLGYHEPNQRKLNYMWDWVSYDYQHDHGAGLVGVRMMAVNTNGTYDLNRDGTWITAKNGDDTTPTVGNVQYGSNKNHVPWVTQGMLDDGFEIWWTCYVAPAMTVNFDLDGGTGAGDYSEQKYKPINSLGEDREDFLVHRPAHNPSKTGQTFVGWYKVLADGTLDTAPWDFENRVVTESMVLKAIYTNTLYTVTFDPNNGSATQRSTYVLGDTPKWNGATPSKPSDGNNTYEFIGWKETTGYYLDNIYVLNGEYDLFNQARTISGNGFNPVTINANYLPTTVYTAQYTQTPIEYTLTFDTNGGIGSFPDITYRASVPFNIYSSVPTKTGYTFSGWTVESTTGDWTGTYTPGQSVSGKHGDTTLIANWIPYYSYQLSFDKNCSDTVSGIPSVNPTGWISDSSHTFTWGTDPIRSGYIFLGWSTSQNGTVVVPAGSMSRNLVGIAAELKAETLYAQWDPYVQYTYIPVTLDEGIKTVDSQAGGTVSPASEQVGCTSGNAQGSVADAKTGYVFRGWFEDSNCTVPVTNNISGNQIQPQKTNGSYSGGTYYALFEREVAIPTELPETGGMGTNTIYAIGALLMLGALTIGHILWRRREGRSEM